MSDSVIDACLAKYAPDMEAQLRAARFKMRALFARGYELIYDNYNALVFAYAPTDRTPDAFISIAGYPRWINLFFLKGVDLHDPHGLLVGSGKTVRGIRLRSPQQLDDADVRALLQQAIKPHATALAAATPLQTIVKSVSAKQRPRRPRST